MELSKMNNPQTPPQYYEDDDRPYNLADAMQQGGSFANPMNNYPNSIQEITDTEDLLNRLECDLLGQTINDKGEKIQIGEALCNQTGAKAIVAIVRSAGSQSSVMSDYEIAEIKTMMEYLNDTMCRNLMLNRYFYEIKNPAARSNILYMANACCFAIYKRGFEGGERRFWKGTQIDQTIRGGDIGKQKGGSFLQGLFKR